MYCFNSSLILQDTTEIVSLLFLKELYFSHEVFLTLLSTLILIGDDIDYSTVLQFHNTILDIFRVTSQSIIGTLEYIERDRIDLGILELRKFNEIVRNGRERFIIDDMY